MGIWRRVRDRFSLAILRNLAQPLTTAQMVHKFDVPSSRSKYTITRLTGPSLLHCLNPHAQRHRLFWLTIDGVHEQRDLRECDGLAALRHDTPDIDWHLYGNVCFSHRAIVIKTLWEPMQPCQIKRRALLHNAAIRFSANNCRDVIRFLKAEGVVRPVQFKRRKHLRYELTPTGLHFRRLLQQAEVRAL